MSNSLNKAAECVHSEEMSEDDRKQDIILDTVGDIIKIEKELSK